MEFKIRLGVPEFKRFWDTLEKKYEKGQLSRDELKQFKKIVKTLQFLSHDTKHNSLCSHEIDELTKKYEIKIFQSYIENNTPSAGRLFWTYGPEQGEITILGFSPHPDESKGTYLRIPLSGLPVKNEDKKEE